jgi:hypothetical protein
VVANTGKTLCAGAVKPVNLPEAVGVEESSAGEPVAVRAVQTSSARAEIPLNPPLRKGETSRVVRKQAVKSIEDRWRIDDEWWRAVPLSRLYYAVLFHSGQRLVLYKDLVSGQWYKQGY